MSGVMIFCFNAFLVLDWIQIFTLHRFKHFFCFVFYVFPLNCYYVESSDCCVMYHRKACISVSKWYPLWKWACSVVPHVQCNTSHPWAHRSNMPLVCCRMTSCWLVMVSGLLWSITTSYLFFSISFSFFFICWNFFSRFLFFIRKINRLWRIKLGWPNENIPIIQQMCVYDSGRTITCCTLCSGLTWPLIENRFSPSEMEVMGRDGETSHCLSAARKNQTAFWIRVLKMLPNCTNKIVQQSLEHNYRKSLANQPSFLSCETLLWLLHYILINHEVEKQ